MRLLAVLLLAAAAASADAGLDAIRTGLGAPGRAHRADAARAARRLARHDPAGVAALFDELDLRGRCELIRALAGAGTGHAAQVAFRTAADADPEVFRALLEGLVDGGAKALMTEAPADLATGRRAALERLRLHWRVEEELLRLKSPAGPTGHYEGQFARIRDLGPGAVDVLFDILEDKRRPVPGAGAAGPYESLHPGMARYESAELRSLSAYSFAETVAKDDEAALERLREVWGRYWRLDVDEYPTERGELAPALAYSLHDLGDPAPGERYLRWLRAESRGSSVRAVSAWWELGYALIRLGRYEEGQRQYEMILQLDAGISRHVAAYNLACNFSLRAMREPRRRAYFKKLALQYLHDAIHKYQYTDWPWMLTDGDLAFIRDEPKFQELANYLREKYPDRKRGTVGKKIEEFLEKAPPPAGPR